MALFELTDIFYDLEDNAHGPFLHLNLDIFLPFQGEERKKSSVSKKVQALYKDNYDDRSNFYSCSTSLVLATKTAENRVRA